MKKLPGERTRVHLNEAALAELIRQFEAARGQRVTGPIRFEHDRGFPDSPDPPEHGGAGASASYDVEALVPGGAR